MIIFFSFKKKNIKKNSCQEGKENPNCFYSFLRKDGKSGLFGNRREKRKNRHVTSGSDQITWHMLCIQVIAEDSGLAMSLGGDIILAISLMVGRIDKQGTVPCS